MSTITRERAALKSFITGFLSDPAHDNQSSHSMTTKVFRIALAVLTAEPFMYAIEDEDGKPHMSEFCVSASRVALQDEVCAMDDSAHHEDERGIYTVVPVYRLPMLEELK